MVNSYDFLNPMNQSVYLESMYPSNKQEVLQYMENYTPQKPSVPNLKPQPTKDSWYYNNDGVDDGKISFKEKLKAFTKGGTYNMIRGLFCDKDGFSIKRTLSSAAIATAIGLTGPIGVMSAGAIGLLAGLGRFAGAAEAAKSAVTDTQAREAYEGYGEGTSTALLSLFGGFKGFKAIKNNFAFAKAHPNLKVGFFDRFLKWNAGKYATLRKPAETPTESPKNPTETVVKPTSEEPAVVEETPVTPKPKKTKKPRAKKTSTVADIPTTDSAQPKIDFFSTKEWNGKPFDIEMPQTKVFSENSPLGKLPSPIGIPESQNWLP